MNPLRSLAAIFGALLLLSLIDQMLEVPLVRATSGVEITDMTTYLAARNRPGILIAKILYMTFAGLLAGYLVAKVVAQRELVHAGIAAALQTALTIYAFTASEFASFTPVWTRIALVLLIGPAMLLGAKVRADVNALRLEEQK